MWFDDVTRLRKYKGNPVSYQGKPYMLLDVFRRKVGTEEVFGAVRDVYEGWALLLVMDGGGSRGLEVLASEVSDTTMKWDFAERCWYDSKEQMAISI